MPIKTILVHLADDPRHQARVETAVGLAQRFKAHLIGLYTEEPAHMPDTIAGRGAALGFLAEETKIAHEHAVDIEQEFLDFCKSKQISTESLSERGVHLDLLVKYAPFADLAIISQSHAKSIEDKLRLHLPDHLPMMAGCPVLVVPYEQASERIGKRILVAWKTSPESGRAVGYAVPFLKTAEQITVLTIDPPDHDYVPGAEIAVRLARHGVKVETRSNLADDRNAGEIICQTAADLDCDMIVMGAYGRSRFRELVLGGITRYTLTHTHVPLLMSH
ncbi:MAG: universal stress protein [Alphaproteobacteria bacterium]|nr:universal stress protein [Alphaproteobacteria bacterium]